MACRVMPSFIRLARRYFDLTEIEKSHKACGFAVCRNSDSYTGVDFLVVFGFFSDLVIVGVKKVTFTVRKSVLMCKVS